MIVVGLVGAVSVLAPSPYGTPPTLHIWGKEFNSTGLPSCDGLDGPLCFSDLLATDGPPIAQPMTEQEMVQDSLPDAPVVLHLQPGILGWLFGVTDAGPKPSRNVPVYLQVGPNAFVRYLWAHCCMPDW